MPEQPIFIKYANVPLKEDPRYLNQIASLVYSYFSTPDEIKTTVALSIEFLEKFSAYRNPQEAEEYLKNLRLNSSSSALILESTFSYAHGYLEDYCNGMCPSNGGIEKWKALGAIRLEGPDRLRCFECDQEYVIYVLSGIVKGKEYSDIIGFSNFIAQAKNFVKTCTVIEQKVKSSPFKEGLRTIPMWESSTALLSLQLFLNGAISYLLGEFLINNDRRKLKKCPFCLEFFIADDIRRQRCKKDECRKEYERQKKRKQRAENPVKYV